MTSELVNFKVGSFPHGRKGIVLSSLLLSIAGFTIALGQASVLGMCLGLAVIVVMALVTSKSMPQVAIVLAAVASLAIAGYQVVEMRSLYKMSHSSLVQSICNLGVSMQDQSDFYNRMYGGYANYCGDGYIMAMVGHAVALLLWLACGVLGFMVPGVEKKEALIGIKDLVDEPVTDFQKQVDASDKGDECVMA